ncbi:MAG: hypothetical protein WCF57_12225, partial [Pyrinomonadaceae bacterium]
MPDYRSSSNNYCSSIHATFLTLLMLVAALFAPQANAQSGRASAARQVADSALIRWSGRPGIKRYRLQLARDEKFTDIIFDRAVTGLEYRVTELPPGSYYWRVAPAAGETGIYSTPAPVQVGSSSSSSGGAAGAALTPADNTGWRTATGNV